MDIQTPTEQRARRRFEMDLPVRFRLTRRISTSRWATGKVQNISSNGISFQCRGPLPLGQHLELSVAWPATRDNDFATQLHATGIIVRSTGTATAMRITWHRLGLDPASAMQLSAIA